MSRKYKIHNPSGVYFATFTVIDWIDVFIRNEYRTIVLDSFKYCQRNKGLEVYAYCFMTSHIHLIIGANGVLPLEGIIRDLKAFTSRHIRKLLESNEQVYESREWMLQRMYYKGKYYLNNIDFQFCSTSSSHQVNIS